MRTLFVGVLGGLAVLVGFASAANASATIDLIWKGGTNDITATSSDMITLEVIATLSEDATANLMGGALSIEWDTNDLVFVSATSNPEGTKGGPGLALPITTGAPSYNGSNQVNLITSGSLPPGTGTGLAAGATHLFGRITFHKGAGDGVTTITPVLTGNDVLILVGNENISATSTFNSATVTTAVPEPGTVALLTLGLAGLALASHRRS